MYMGVQCVVCCMFRSRFLRAGALCVHAHAMVRAQGRALCACLGPPGLRAGSALTRADVLVLLCVFGSHLAYYHHPYHHSTPQLHGKRLRRPTALGQLSGEQT